MADEVPSNILSLIAGQNRPSPGPDWAQVDSGQRAAIAMQEHQQKQVGANAMKWLYSDPSHFVDSSTMLQPKPEVFSQVLRMAGPAAMDVQHNFLAMQRSSLLQEGLQSDVQKKWRDDAMGGVKPIDDEYTTNIQKGMPEPEAMAAANGKYKAWRDEFLIGKPPSFAAQVAPNFDHMRFQKNQMTVQQQAQQARVDRDEARADRGEKRADEDLVLRKGAAARATEKASTPTSFGDVKLPDGSIKKDVPLGWAGEGRGYFAADDPDRKPVELVGAPRKEGTEKAATGEYGKVSQIAIDDPDTPGETKIVPAQQNTKTGQWVTADANRDPLPTPKRIVSTGGSGRQAEAQAMAMINAGNEASASLKNLVELPVGATSGWFKGLTSQTPESLSSAIGRGVAGFVNEGDARSLQISWQGIGRSLATLEAAGRATGLVGLQKQAEALQPQKGDTYTNVLRSYAEIRQIIDRSIETIKTSPGVSSDQKKLLTKIADEAKTTVPWTVHDVNMLETGGKDSVLEFAKKVKVGAEGGVAAPVASAPIPPGEAAEVTEQQYNALPSGAAYRVPGNTKVMYKP